MISKTVRDSPFGIYDLEHTDVNIDTTSVSVYPKRSKLFNFGYSGDKRPDLRQVNFGSRTPRSDRHPVPHDRLRGGLCGPPYNPRISWTIL